MIKPKDINRLKQMLLYPDEERQKALYELGTWVVSTCLLFGAELSTAYKVAAIFVEGLENSYRKTDDIEKGN